MKNAHRKAMGRLQSNIRTNEFIYWIRRIPFVKHFVSNNAYSNPSIKRFFHVIDVVFNWFIQVLGSTVFLILISLVANFVDARRYLVLKSRPLSSWTEAYVLLITASVLILQRQSVVMSEDKTKWLLIRQFRANPLDVYTHILRHDAMCLIIKGLVYAMPAFVNGAFLLGICVLFVPLMNQLLHDGIALRTFRITQKKTPFKRALGRFLGTLVGVVGCITLIQSPLIIVILWNVYLGMGVINFYSEFKRCDINQVSSINRMLTQSMKLSTNAKQEALELQIEASRIDDDVNVQNDTKIVTSMSGFRMINYLFYKRHQRIWMKSLRRSVKVLLIIVALITTALSIGYLIDGEGMRAFANEGKVQPYLLLRWFIFSIGFSNITEPICRAFFLNCDGALLHYAFYRRKEIIWKQYLSRLGTLIALNLIPTLLLCLIPVILLGFNMMHYSTDFIYLIVNTIVISMFFTSLYLVLYYLIQPYNIDMEVKSPLYRIITSLFIFLIYYLPEEAIKVMMNYSEFMIVALIAFIFVSLGSVYVFGKKTFKLRRS